MTESKAWQCNTVRCKMFNPIIFYLPVMPAQIYGQHILPKFRFTFMKNVNCHNSLLRSQYICRIVYSLASVLKALLSERDSSNKTYANLLTSELTISQSLDKIFFFYQKTVLFQSSFHNDWKKTKRNDQFFKTSKPKAEEIMVVLCLKVFRTGIWFSPLLSTQMK